MHSPSLYRKASSPPPSHFWTGKGSQCKIFKGSSSPVRANYAKSIFPFSLHLSRIVFLFASGLLGCSPLQKFLAGGKRRIRIPRLAPNSFQKKRHFDGKKREKRAPPRPFVFHKLFPRRKTSLPTKKFSLSLAFERDARIIPTFRWHSLETPAFYPSPFHFLGDEMTPPSFFDEDDEDDHRR